MSILIPGAKAEMKRARRSHLCSECGGFIKFGEQYQRVHTAEKVTYWTCTECARIRKAYNRMFDAVPLGKLYCFLASHLPKTNKLMRDFQKNRRQRTLQTR